MSAWIVPDNHLRLLVEAAGRNRQGERLSYYHGTNNPTRYTVNEYEPESMDRTMAMLYAENVKSIRHRYEDDDTDPNNAPKYRGANCRLSDVAPIVVLKSIDCYEYQSCEHPEWEASEAYAFCRALRRWVYSHMAGYDDAPWGFEGTPVLRAVSK